MPILPRYLLRQFLPVFGAGLALFLGVLLMNQFLRLFTTAMMKGLPLWWILACFSRLLPSLAGLALPMAFLIAAMITLAHLTETGEITALRASGFSYYEIVRPFLWLGLALSVLLLAVNHKFGPEGYRSFRKRTTEAGQKMARLDLRPRSFVNLGPWRLYARDSNQQTGQLEGVYLVRPSQQEAVRVNAERGRIRLDPGRGIDLELEDGQLQLPNKDPRRFTSGRFARYQVHLPLSAPAMKRDLDMQELTTRELRRRIADPETPKDRRLEYKVESAVRTAGAFSPFVFFWVGVPLGMTLKRRSRGLEFAAGLGVLFGFYALLVLGISLGRRGESVAPYAPFLCDVVGLAAGAWLTRRAASR